MARFDKVRNAARPAEVNEYRVGNRGWMPRVLRIVVGNAARITSPIGWW
tara:strand:- start:538 stop:684 length:147 start_codon:yes stop_codon:yes gene_type:complete